MTTVDTFQLRQGAAELARLESIGHTDEQVLLHSWRYSPAIREFFRDERTFLAWARNCGRCLHIGSGAYEAEHLQGGLREVGFRNVQGTYFLRYEDAVGQSWAGRVASQVPANQPIELHKWLGAVPMPEKFTGERKRTSLRDFGLQVVSEKFTATMDADVDDVRRDKTGQLLRRVGELASKTAELSQHLLVQLLEKNPNGYDQYPLFGTAHPNGGQSNDITSTGVASVDEPTSAEMAKAILAAVQKMAGQLDDRGQPMNEGARRFVLLVPTKFMAATLGALQAEYLAPGVSNTLPTAGVAIAPFFSARLNSSASAAGRRFYLFREDASVLPLLQQEEEIPDAFKSQDLYSSGGFWHDKVAWGSKRITAVAPGRWELAMRVNLSA